MGNKGISNERFNSLMDFEMIIEDSELGVEDKKKFQESNLREINDQLKGGKN